jgi:hypothetical protein
LNIELAPVLSKGVIKEVNDTAVVVYVKGRLGVITVPLRWVFTDKPLEPDQEVEFYFSYMQVI